MFNKGLWVRLHIINPKSFKILKKNRFSFRILTNKYTTFLDLAKCP